MTEKIDENEVKEWNAENITKFILACRKQEGIPIFMTHYAGVHFKHNAENAALGKCFAGRGPEMTTWFKGVPEKCW